MSSLHYRRTHHRLLLPTGAEPLAAVWAAHQAMWSAADFDPSEPRRGPYAQEDLGAMVADTGPVARPFSRPGRRRRRVA